MDVEASTEAAPRELIPDESDRPEVVQNTYNEAPTRSTLGEDECIGRRAFQFNDHSGNFRPESKCHMAVDLGVLWHCQTGGGISSPNGVQDVFRPYRITSLRRR